MKKEEVVGLFDPITGKVIDHEALRSIQFNGQGMSIPKSVIKDDKKITAVIDPETGAIDGTKTEHGSGRIDQNVFAKSVKISNNPQGV